MSRPRASFVVIGLNEAKHLASAIAIAEGLADKALNQRLGIAAPEAPVSAGFADLELGLLRQMGLVQADTPIVTTVHPLQIVDNG